MMHKYLTLCILIFLLGTDKASKNIEKIEMKFVKGQYIKLSEGFDSFDMEGEAARMTIDTIYEIVDFDEFGMEIQRKKDNEHFRIFEVHYNKIIVVAHTVDKHDEIFQSSKKSNIINVSEVYEYAIYNMIDVSNQYENSLYECFFIASSMLNQIDPAVQKFNNKLDIKEQILNYCQKNLVKYEHFFEQQIFFELLRINVIVYQKEEVGNDDYVEKSRFFDPGFNHTIRLAYINPESMHYALLKKENIHVVEEEYPWCPRENDRIEDIKTKKKYRVITATEEEFITVINLEDNTDDIIDLSEESDAIYNYDLMDISIDDQEIKEFKDLVNKFDGFWQVSDEQKDQIYHKTCSIEGEEITVGLETFKASFSTPNIITYTIEEVKHTGKLHEDNIKKYIYWDDNTVWKSVLNESNELPNDTPFTEGQYVEVVEGFDDWINLNDTVVGDILRVDSVETKLGIVEIKTTRITDNHKISIKKNNFMKVKVTSSNFNTGDHIEALESFQTNAFYANQMNIFRGQKLVIKKKRNGIIFVLNATGESWTHLQPIDATNFKNLKHSDNKPPYKVLVKEDKYLLQ